MITGVLFLIVSVALHILIPSQIRTYETSAVTAATVPTLLIRGMILCSVILLVQGILSKEKTEYTISGAIFTKENLLRLKPVIYIAMLIAYALLLPHIGFIISSLLLANGILLYFGTRKWWFYAIASANVIVAYFAFQAMSVMPGMALSSCESRSMIFSFSWITLLMEYMALSTFPLTD